MGAHGMERREFLKRAGLAGSAALGLSVGAPAATHAPRRPNILFLMTDQHTGEIRKDVLNEKVLSAILEFKIREDQLEQVVRQLQPVLAEVGDTCCLSANPRRTWRSKGKSTVFRDVLFLNCRLAYSTFALATLHDVSFSGCNLHGADLDYAAADGVSYKDTMLWGAKTAFGCSFWTAEFDEESCRRFLALVARTVAPHRDRRQTRRREAFGRTIQQSNQPIGLHACLIIRRPSPLARLLRGGI